MKYYVVNAGEDIFKTIGYLKKREVACENMYNAAFCDIYMRGEVWVIADGEDVLYYEAHNENYPFFEIAFHYMNVEKYAVWKTVGELITFRNAIREATVQGTDYVETILEEPLTKRIYQQFMRMARAHDMVHHGIKTF